MSEGQDGPFWAYMGGEYVLLWPHAAVQARVEEVVSRSASFETLDDFKDAMAAVFAAPEAVPREFKNRVAVNEAVQAAGLELVR